MSIANVGGGESGGDLLGDFGNDSTANGAANPTPSTAAPVKAGGDLLDLDDIFGGGGSKSSNASVPAVQATQ